MPLMVTHRGKGTLPKKKTRGRLTTVPRLFLHFLPEDVIITAPKTLQGCPQLSLLMVPNRPPRLYQGCASGLPAPPPRMATAATAAATDTATAAATATHAAILKLREFSLEQTVEDELRRMAGNGYPDALADMHSEVFPRGTPFNFPRLMRAFRVVRCFGGMRRASKTREEDLAVVHAAARLDISFDRFTRDADLAALATAILEFEVVASKDLDEGVALAKKTLLVGLRQLYLIKALHPNVGGVDQATIDAQLADFPYKAVDSNPCDPAGELDRRIACMTGKLAALCDTPEQLAEATMTIIATRLKTLLIMMVCLTDYVHLDPAPGPPDPNVEIARVAALALELGGHEAVDHIQACIAWRAANCPQLAAKPTPETE